MDTRLAQNDSSIDAFIADGTPPAVVARYRGLAAAAAAADFGVLDEDVVIMDTETTGTSYSRDELTQIAAARMKGGEVVERFSTFVNPGKPIPEEVAHLTDIHDEDVADAPDVSTALKMLVEFVGDSYLVAHNASFDYAFCTNHAAGFPLKNNVWVDSLDLARIALPRMRSHRLIDLVHAFGAPVSTHRADADVEALCVVYRILLAAVAAMPPTLVNTIASMTTEDRWPTARVFRALGDADGEAFNLRKARVDALGESEARQRIDADAIAQDPNRDLVFADDEWIDEAFSAKGIVGSMYEGFEPRAEQIRMAHEVNDAFRNGDNLAVEAGTGVGKSMAYLIPAIYAAKHNDIGIGVATKTNALLDQLVHRELPLLSKACGGVTWAALKGFSHYPCLVRLNRQMDTGPKTREVAGTERQQAPSLAGVLSFVEQSDFDDIDGLKVDYAAFPRYLFTTTSNDCLRRKCPFYSTCFVHGARARAAAADIVVTNHTLLFCDIVAEGGLLPPLRYWVVDEAHGAEDEARRAFSLAIDLDDLARIADRIGTEDARYNVYLRAERRCAGRADITLEEVREILQDPTFSVDAKPGEGVGDALLYGLSGKARRAGAAFAEAQKSFSDAMGELSRFDAERSSDYDRVELWIDEKVRASDAFDRLREAGEVLKDTAERVLKTAAEMVAFLDNIEGAVAEQREIAACSSSLREVVNACDVILFRPSPIYAYSARYSRKRETGRVLEALLLNVGEKLNETLYANTHSVVFTSATMTVADDFTPFRTAMGLEDNTERHVKTCALPSSYDFDAHMTVYVADDMPEPTNRDAYLRELNRLLLGVHLAQGGGVLSLFTNRRDMEHCFDEVVPGLREADLRAVCQKWGVSTKGLRDDFLQNHDLSLFALKSFWEGFDAPGDTLRTVVIPKLPFGRPTDPLSRERELNDSGAWHHFVLPKAVLEVKQAAGRLIRSSTDTGNLVLADHRLISKGYGNKFLKSLPSKTVVAAPIDEIIERLQRR